MIQFPPHQVSLICIKVILIYHVLSPGFYITLNIVYLWNIYKYVPIKYLLI